jgi:hypothetical protein
VSALHEALRVARDMIATDRHAFADCNVLPEGGFDADDAQVVADYDRALAQIDAALASAPRVPLTDEQVFDLIPSTGLLPRRDALWLARAVERAHGIAAAPQPEGGAS